MNLVRELAGQVGTARACQVLNMPRSSFYRAQQPVKPAPPRPRPPRALSLAEQEQVLGVLHGPRFVDCAPVAVWATLLDEGVYHCSARTMYRLLRASGEVRERRDHLHHPPYRKPELLAQKPNEVWTWDITELRGPVKYMRFYLYVLLDLFSRYVVGWMVAELQNHQLAQQLINQALEREQIVPGQLTIHADRGATMVSKPLGFMLSDLGILKSHSRPHCSNDNPFVESHFRTLKYRPEFPDRFGSVFDAREFCRTFFDWYHHQHRHSGLGWMTPHCVHHGQSEATQLQRQDVLDSAYGRNPERFVRKAPQAPELPSAVWINPPSEEGSPTQPVEQSPSSAEPTFHPKQPVMEVDPKKQGSQLPYKRFSHDGEGPDTPCGLALPRAVDKPKPPFGLELNSQNQLSQSR